MPYRLRRKNCRELEMGFVTVFSAFTTTGSGKAVVQCVGEASSVVDSKMKPVELVGHVITMFVPIGTMVSCGGPDNMRLKTVP